MPHACITGVDPSLTSTILGTDWEMVRFDKEIPPEILQTDLVVVGEHVENPFGVIQEIRRKNKQVSLMLLVSPEKLKKYSQGLIFAPGVGYNNKVISSDAPGLHGLALSLARSTRQRESFSKLNATGKGKEELFNQRSGNFLEAFLETAPVGAVLLDQGEVILLVNRQARKFFNLAEKKLIGERFQKLFPPHTTKVIQKIVSNPEPTESEIDLRPYSELVLEVSSSRVKDGSDNPYTLVLLHDTTTRKVTGEQLVRRVKDLKKANADLEEMAYAISHDLKAPVRGIATLIHWLQTDHGDELSEEGKKLVTMVMEKTFHLQNLLEGVLGYYRAGQENSVAQEVSLDDIVDSALELTILPKHVSIERGDLGSVKGNFVLLQQVFLNLINNAINHNDKKEIKISITSRVDGDYREISVQDNGPGIKKEYYDRIFRMFETLEASSERKSTGIGLTIVKRVIEQRHEGSIKIKSEIGKGTTFIIRLPTAGIDEKFHVET